MSKRKASETFGHDEQPVKRWKTTAIGYDHLSKISHELILRVLAYLPVPDLIACHSLSRHFYPLASDSQLWKAHYYNRFVRPRAARLPGIRGAGVPVESLHFSSKLSKWLDEESLVRRGQETNWKRQYKTRHNWSKGSCGVSELPVAEEPSIPPILVQMHESTIFMADRTDGLRAWTSASGRKLLASLPLYDPDSSSKSSPPSALAIDGSAGAGAPIDVAVAFQDGSFSLYQLHSDMASFSHRYTHEPSSNGMLSAIALSFPYFASMTASQLLSIYEFTPVPASEVDHRTLAPPRLLQSLHSRTVWPPMTLSIRPSSESVLVSIAYALPTYLSGWTVGIQEMRVIPTGELKGSRLASAIDQQYQSLTQTHAFVPATSPDANLAYPPFGHFGTSEPRQVHAKPTSLSYTHPYLLVTHPDNTLTLYLVSSTAASLSISPGNRLWGHTSSVSGAHVAGRGKAVSVSKRGDELRVWELEGGFASAAARRRLAAGELSVQLRPDKHLNTDVVTTAIAARGDGLGLALEHRFDETSMTRGWVGFDEERVVVLKEKGCGGQALVVYDFT